MKKFQRPLSANMEVGAAVDWKTAKTRKRPERLSAISKFAEWLLSFFGTR